MYFSWINVKPVAEYENDEKGAHRAFFIFGSYVVEFDKVRYA